MTGPLGRSHALLNTKLIRQALFTTTGITVDESHKNRFISIYTVGFWTLTHVWVAFW